MKKGQMILMTMLLISVFLAILFSLAAFMFNDQINQRRIDNSMSAYYAAESGLERAILEVKSGLPTQPDTITVNLNSNSSFTVNWEPIASNKVKIESIGKSKNVRRKLETEIDYSSFVNGVPRPEYWIETSPTS